MKPSHRVALTLFAFSLAFHSEAQPVLWSLTGNSPLATNDQNGRVLKTVTVTERGASSILVYASNLSSGTYTYSLNADGKLIDTKKMTCQK